MKKKYFVAVSFQCEVETDSDVQALREAAFIAPYDKGIRHLSMKVVRVVLPAQPPEPPSDAPQLDQQSPSTDSDIFG